MKVKYDKLFAKLKREGINQEIFRESVGIGGTTLQRLRYNGSITVDTICHICDFFCCTPDEIMEWIPEDDYEERRQAKAELQRQIAELEAKKKELQAKLK